MQIYLALHRIEFTWFHYSLSVHPFCCTSPNYLNDNRRELPAILLYGVRTFLSKNRAIRRPALQIYNIVKNYDYYSSSIYINKIYPYTFDLIPKTSKILPLDYCLENGIKKCLCYKTPQCGSTSISHAHLDQNILYFDNNQCSTMLSKGSG